MTDVAHRFNNLSMEKKSSLLNSYGHWVWCIDYKYYHVTLYEIKGQLIEVWYDLRSDVIWQIRIPEYKDLDIHLQCITFTFE